MKYNSQKKDKNYCNYFFQLDLWNNPIKKVQFEDEDDNNQYIKHNSSFDNLSVKNRNQSFVYKKRQISQHSIYKNKN